MRLDRTDDSVSVRARRMIRPKVDLPVPIHDDPLALKSIIFHLRIEESRGDQSSVKGDCLALDSGVCPSIVVCLDEFGAVAANMMLSSSGPAGSREPRDLLFLFDSHTQTLYSAHKKRRSHDLLAAVTIIEM